MKESILRRYPNIDPDSLILRDDGNGPYIDKWPATESKPTMDEVNAWVAEDAAKITPEPLTPDQKKIAALEADNADMNLQIINLYEMVLGA